MMVMSLGLACNLCGECVSVCSGKALTIASDELVYDGGKCTTVSLVWTSAQNVQSE